MLCAAYGRARAAGAAAHEALDGAVPRHGSHHQRGAQTGRQPSAAGRTRRQDRRHGAPAQDRRVGNGGIRSPRHRDDGHGACHARHLHGRPDTHTADIYRRQDIRRQADGASGPADRRPAAPHDAYGRSGRCRQRLLELYCRTSQSAHARKLLHADGHHLQTDLIGRSRRHGHRE